MRDIQAAIEERVQLYFWGRATYEDMFEGSEPHFLEFCYRLDVTGTAPDSDCADVHATSARTTAPTRTVSGPRILDER